MDSDSELQICEQSDTSDLLDNEYSLDNLKTNHEDQIKNLHNNSETVSSIDSEFSKKCQSLSEVIDKAKQLDCNKDLVMKNGVTSKFQNDNTNTRKRKTQGTEKKVLTPLMKNALKQSRQEVSLLECTQKASKNDSDIINTASTGVPEKVEIKSNKIRSAICIDISEAPPVKIARKSKPSNSLLNKISNIKLLNQSNSLPTASENLGSSGTLDRLPSNLIISNLKKKFNCSKEEAVRRYVEKCREEKAKVNNVSNVEDDKLSVKSDEMPWIPNFTFPDRDRFTSLSDADHKRYVAITMNLIKQNPEFRFIHNVTELKDFDNRLHSERALFHKISFEAIDSKKKSCYRFRLPSWNKLMYSCTEARSKNLKKFNKNNYECINNYEFDSNMEPLPLSDLGIYKENHGNGATITIPDLRKKCIFDSKVVHEKKKFYNINNIVDDKNAETISSTYNAKVLMDATTFSRLIIGKWGCDNLEYSFPVNVTQQFVNGCLENIVTISKPIPSSPPSTRTLAYKVMKYVVKGGVDKNYFDVPKESKDNCQDRNETHKFVSSFQDVPSSPTHGDDSSTVDVVDEVNENKIDENNSCHRGKIYHILNLNARTSNPNFNILIRSNCAERDCFGKKLSLSHHVEYFPEIGAEKLFPEEIIHNYIKCFFRDANHAVIFRVHNSTCNVLQKEFIDLLKLQNRVYNECLNIWKSGLQKVRNILMKLMTVPGGDYLLEESDDTYKLYSEVISTDDEAESCQNDFRLALQGSNEEDVMIRCRTLNSSGIFNGVSHHVPLMWNFVLSRIPGSLPKRKKNFNQNKFHNNKGKQKKKVINNSTH